MVAPYPSIKVRELVKSFGEEQVLKKVDLDLYPDSINFIIGRSGEGKSVLLKIMCGLYSPDAGSVYFDDLDMVKATSKQVRFIRSKSALLFQDGALFDSMSVGQNVVFPLWFHKLASPALAKQKAEHLLSELGLGTSFEARVSDLSSGEKKRVALARALITEPKAVFFDEPTTGLDPLISSQVDELIVHAKKKTGATVVVVSHDMAAALTLADYINLLYNGRVVFSGPPLSFKVSKEPEIIRFLTSNARAA
ncbi:MAG: ATP-binding cassette domain-containing protein [Deltaproteobacteria bacterium]|jgi:phospholipid/cholesterol/gamma-HCH transport system ATP-binding protein|nr:ATP-binding cassette domain-containing protein [Deltaproteobacteria bacterium]